MLKTVGLSVIMLCTFSFGVCMANDTKKQLSALKELLAFMKHIERKIDYFNSPLDAIYDNYCTSSPYFADFVKNISIIGWTASLDSPKKLVFSPKTKAFLKEFGELLGKSNRESQLKHIRYYIQLIDDEYTELLQKSPEKNKLSVTLSIYAGLMIFILFI